MILAKTQYTSYNIKFSAILKVFKTLWYYLKDYKDKILVFTNYNNFYQFINLKILSYY